ncbi:MAG TPA: S41 family peptidase [Woeseiaceae bacterium]|nr:S41 family peptidase [Woeseiaceae bacterium]
MFLSKYLRQLSVSVLIIATTAAGSTNAETVRFAAFPDVSATQVVFVYRDSIWLVPVAGGPARLLSDIGTRPRNPKFSPDGKQVAYAATRDDNQDIFVVDLAGGAIRRITNHPARDDMVDWYPDGKTLLFKSTMQSPRAIYDRLFKVDSTGGLPQVLPLPYVETAAISSDGERILFTYLRDFQEEVWKRYLGGRAPDIWSYDISSGDTVQLTTSQAPDSVPMLKDDGVYFLSERGPSRRSNIWFMRSNGKDARQLTHFDESDVRYPSVGPAGIVFDVDGDLYLQKGASQTAERIAIDIDIARDEYNKKRVQLAERVESASIGATGSIAIEARGDILLYDTDENSAVNVSNSSNAAERFPSLSPDGSMLAYQSDASGEYQLYTRQLDTGTVEQLTDFKAGFRYRPFWSPDGKYIAFIDQQEIVWIATVKDRSLQKVDQGHWRYHWDLPQFRVSWSPDSQWLTYSRAGQNRNQAIYVYNVGSRKLEQLTSAFYSDFDPVFDPTGNYIAALGYRSFDPTFGDIDSTFTYTDSTVVTIMPLRSGVDTPVEPDWQVPAPQDIVAIDVADAESRLRVLPFLAGHYTTPAFSGNILSAVRSIDDTTQLVRLELGNDKVETSWNGDSATLLDANTGGTLLHTGDGKVLFLEPDSDGNAEDLDLGQLSAEIDPQQEFLQMFDDSWRYQRDFFYDPGLHGIDWDAIKKHYRPLAAAAHSVQELTAIVREMHGELSAGHVYVSIEPPYNRRDATNVGLLGIDFVVKNGAYAIGHILRPGVRRAEHHSPLDNSALAVAEGDYILSVNGRPLTTDRAPWVQFTGLADQLVNLEVAKSASGDGARTIRIRTLTSERKLRELVWVEETRQHVDTASHGKIGYIYVPNTGAEGQNELMQMYRAQYQKQALIIDERFNTGGALGDRFVELLNRPPLVYFSSRNSDNYPLPELANRGPKALLINSWSYSGGDGFPLLFKSAGVGPLIGTRTWGGLIGPGMRMSLINGGFISAPPQRVYDTSGNWAEGNEGVRPTIPLRNDPGVLARGVDQQLERAIELLLHQLEELPPVVIPEYPNQMPLPSAGN